MAAVGEHGEVEVAGPTVMRGYWEDEAATRAAFDGPRLRTGTSAIRTQTGISPCLTAQRT
jgi:fatty-acyl-CoA synthase